MITAVDEDFSGWVVDYGTWPEQPIAHFALNEVQHTIQKKTGIMQVGPSIRSAVMTLTTELSQRRFERSDGAQSASSGFMWLVGLKPKRSTQ